MNAITDPAGDPDDFKVVFDASGNRASMQVSVGRVAPIGNLVLVGVLQADITFADAEFHKREKTLMASRNATIGDFDHVIAAILDGSVPASALITHVLPIDDLADALPHLAHDKNGIIKAMVEIR